MLKVLKFIFQLIDVVIILVLMVLHFVIKEQTFWSSLYFYVFPLPVIILIILALSVVLTKRWRLYNLKIALILLLIWLGRSFKIHIPDTIEETDLEVVFWNASRDNGLNEAIAINKGIPDVLVLVESKKNNLEVLQAKYPDYYFYKSVRGIMIFSKTPLEIISEETSKYNSTVVNFKTVGINFYVVDVSGSTDVPRAWELGYVNKLIEKQENTIIVGDFNVPYESKFLNPLKQQFNHVFNKKGNGFRETWAWGIPLLSIDHIWFSKDLKILKTQKINTWKSDHSMINVIINQ